jgi:hypothetical protein
MKPITAPGLFLGLTRLVACVALIATFQLVAAAQTPDRPVPCVTEPCPPQPPPIPPVDIECTEKLPCPKPQATITEAAASVVPVRDANNNPISNVQALVSVVDNGVTLDITGLATGMDPTQQYVSLFYDTASQDTTLNACLPTAGGPQQTFSQMVIGVWLPLGTSTRTLKASKFGPPASPVPLAYLAVNQIGTVSVRLDTRATTPVPNAPDPSRFVIQSCGRLNVTRITRVQGPLQ